MASGETGIGKRPAVGIIKMLGLQLDGPAWSCLSIFVYSRKKPPLSCSSYPKPSLDSTGVNNFSQVPRKHTS